MSRRAWRNTLTAAAIAWTLIVLAYLLWHYIMVALIGYAAWRFLLHRMGVKRRPKATWARNVTAVPAAFAAWQSRWFNPHRAIRARVPASAAARPVLFDQEWDEIPY